MEEESQKREPAAQPKLAFSVKEAMTALGFGRNAFYNAVNRKELVTYKAGGRRYVSLRAINEFIEARERAGRDGASHAA